VVTTDAEPEFLQDHHGSARFISLDRLVKKITAVEGTVAGR
jgi:hypothetical protein